MGTRKLAATALAALLINFGAIAIAKAQPQAVALELVLLVDTSASVDLAEYQLQARGLATAFRSQSVQAAIARAGSEGIAVALVQWAERDNQTILGDWHHLRGPEDANRFAGVIEAMSRPPAIGHTAIGDALTAGSRELRDNAFIGKRQVIDVSGDGRNNDGRPLSQAREEVLDKGITINGLAILNEVPKLDGYYRDRVIGGPNAFVTSALDFRDFENAMIRKLVREIAPLNVAEKRY